MLWWNAKNAIEHGEGLWNQSHVQERCALAVQQPHVFRGERKPKLSSLQGIVKEPYVQKQNRPTRIGLVISRLACDGLAVRLLSLLESIGFKEGYAQQSQVFGAGLSNRGGAALVNV